MIDDRQFRTDDLIQSAAELPEVSPDFRKRVLKAARKAEHQRLVRRRLQWALGGSAAAIMLATIFSVSTAPEHPTTRFAPGDMTRSAPGIIVPDNPRAKDDKSEEADRHKSRNWRYR